MTDGFIVATQGNPHRITIGGTVFLVREPTVEEGLSLLEGLESDSGYHAAVGAYKQAARIGLIGWEGDAAPKFMPNDPGRNVQLLSSDAYIAIASYVIEHARASVETLGNSLSPSNSPESSSTAAAGLEGDASDINQASRSGNSRMGRRPRPAPGH